MWPIGYKFKYESIYGACITGVIKQVDKPSNYKKLTLYNYDDIRENSGYAASYSIDSTTGARYPLNDIEIETISDIRDIKLKKLGI